MKARGHSGPESERTARSRFWRGVKWTFGGVFVLVLATVAVIGGSVWIENRHPSDETGRALLPRFQKWVTRPIVETSGRLLSRYFQDLVEDAFIDSHLSLKETIRDFDDPSAPLADRRRHAFRLAREGTPEAVSALRQALATASPEHRAYLAWLIGSTRNPAMKELLWPLLDDSDERVVRGRSAASHSSAAKWWSNEWSNTSPTQVRWKACASKQPLPSEPSALRKLAAS